MYGGGKMILYSKTKNVWSVVVGWGSHLLGKVELDDRGFDSHYLLETRDHDVWQRHDKWRIAWGGKLLYLLQVNENSSESLPFELFDPQSQAWISYIRLAIGEIENYGEARASDGVRWERIQDGSCDGWVGGETSQKWRLGSQSWVVGTAVGYATNDN